MVLEKDGEDQLDRSSEKWKSITESQEGRKYPTCSKKEGRPTGVVISCIGTAF